VSRKATEGKGVDKGKEKKVENSPNTALIEGGDRGGGKRGGQVRCPSGFNEKKDDGKTQI